MALLNALYKMQQSGEWCDVHLVSSCGEVLNAHACVLSAASTKLEEMIKLGVRNSETMVILNQFIFFFCKRVVNHSFKSTL